MKIDLELLALCGLVHNPSFCVRAIPHIKATYFEQKHNRLIFNIIVNHYTKYNAIPTEEALYIELEEQEGIVEDTFKAAQEATDRIYSEKAQTSISKTDEEWLTDKIEKWCLDRSVYLGITQCIEILDSEENDKDKGSLPGIMEDALSVSFNTDIGHDYLKDYGERYDFYHAPDSRIELPIRLLNAMTRGGPPKKSLSLCLAPTGVGKSLWLSFLTTWLLKQGYKVLYITLEMSEEMIGERMDSANLDCPIDNLTLYQKDSFEKAINRLREQYTGEIIIQEYAPGSANVNHIRYFMDEVKLKRNIIPDVVVVDYINLMASATLKKRDNMYLYLKAVAEELRGLAVERNVAVMSACQTNRSGQNAGDYDLNEMGESHGLSQTGDFVFGLIETPEMRAQGHYRVKPLKNRFGPLYPQSFVVGVDKSKMIMYDLDEDSPLAHKDNETQTAKDPKEEKKNKITNFKF